MNRRFPALAAALALALVTACGEDEGSPYTPGDQGEPMGDPAAYFGVTPCQCLEFTRADGTFDLALGIAVETLTDVYSVALEGQDTVYHVLRYRYGGQVKRTDFLRPTEPDLLLAGVNYGSDDWDHLIRIDPAVPYLRFPLDKQVASVQAASTTQAAPGGAAEGEPVALPFRADFTQASVIASTDGGEPTEMQAIRVLYDNVPWKDVTRYYVPRTGLVKIDIDLDGGGKKTWVLKRIRQLEGGCPWGGADSIPPDQICGSNP